MPLSFRIANEGKSDVFFEKGRVLSHALILFVVFSVFTLSIHIDSVSETLAQASYYSDWASLPPYATLIPSLFPITMMGHHGCRAAFAVLLIDKRNSHENRLCYFSTIYAIRLKRYNKYKGEIIG